MKVEQNRPLREHPRFVCSLDVSGNQLAAMGIPFQGVKSPIHGRIENISKSGLCVVSKHSIPASSLVRCEISVSGTRAVIPTLLQVRWARRSSTSNGYKIGLQFLL
jgi:hypothetical protein